MIRSSFLLLFFFSKSTVAFVIVKVQTAKIHPSIPSRHNPGHTIRCIVQSSPPRNPLLLKRTSYGHTLARQDDEAPAPQCAMLPLLLPPPSSSRSRA